MQSWDVDVTSSAVLEQVPPPKQAVGVEIRDEQPLVKSGCIGWNWIGRTIAHPVVLAFDYGSSGERSNDEEHEQQGDDNCEPVSFHFGQSKESVLSSTVPV